MEHTLVPLQRPQIGGFGLGDQDVKVSSSQGWRALNQVNVFGGEEDNVQQPDEVCSGSPDAANPYLFANRVRWHRGVFSSTGGLEGLIAHNDPGAVLIVEDDTVYGGLLQG